MGLITDLLKEIPLSAVIRERLTEAEAKMLALEKENTALKVENQNLKRLAEQRQEQKPADVCPFCRRSTGELIDIKPSPNPHYASMGFKQGYYRCRNCRREYDKELPQP